MMDRQSDPHWSHFKPLWIGLRGVAPDMLLAGGYGLFLKQRWLVSRAQYLASASGDSLVTAAGDRLVAPGHVRTLVGVGEWVDQVPRVTQDLDVIVQIDLIALPTHQARAHNILADNGFQVSEGNPRWQFNKSLGGGRDLVLDILTPKPKGKPEGAKVDGRRVKPAPSLKGKGIHGRTTPEAEGSALHPFLFETNGVEIAVPNPATWSVMKLTAMRDRWDRSQDPDNSREERDVQHGQATKHALDVCRIVAMTTREENDRITDVLDAIRGADAFKDAIEIADKFFLSDGGWADGVVRAQWRDENLRDIREALSVWFS